MVLNFWLVKLEVNNKYFIFILLFILLISCSNNIKNNIRIEENCSNIEINIEDESIENKLFNVDLKSTLKKNFDIIFNKNNVTKNKLCVLNIKIIENEYSTLISNSGNTSRMNKKIKIDYTLTIKNYTFNKSMVLFYGTNISRYVYSNYVKNKKEDRNNIETISKKIFFDIINNFK